MRLVISAPAKQLVLVSGKITPYRFKKSSQ
jgi:hypothetical protein